MPPRREASPLRRGGNGCPEGPPGVFCWCGIPDYRELTARRSFKLWSARNARLYPRGGLGKPTGVRGVQLWRKIGDPAPAAESDFEFVSEFTRTRMTLKYQMTQGGQTVYYQARWVSTRGETGPWGELVSATVVK